MNLLEVINRPAQPTPWAEGEKIPWHEPGFSARMLKEHLNQSHDRASRRLEKIERQVAWIHKQLLRGQPTRVLDLACGPGFYAARLAQLGHTCLGIDFSPASIAYAGADAADRLGNAHQRCTYQLNDIRQAEYGAGYGLAMLIFGEFNVFKPEDACQILRKIHAALEPGGWLLLEPHTFEAVQALGGESPAWYSSKGGLWSEKPHLCLQESLWDEARKVATERYWIFDGASGMITRYASSTQAYTQGELEHMLQDAGFSDITFYPSMMGQPDPEQTDLLAITCRK